jgi:hypothetical protein
METTGPTTKPPNTGIKTTIYHDRFVAAPITSKGFCQHIRVATNNRYRKPTAKAPVSMPIRTATISNGTRFSLSDLKPHFIPEKFTIISLKKSPSVFARYPLC